MNSDPTEGVWHNRTVDLSPFAGKTVNNLFVVADSGTPVGAWNIYYGDISIVSADGTVTTIYDRAPGESFSYFSGGGETNPTAIVERADSSQVIETTSYYLANQVGSTMEMLSSGGWPVAQNAIYPYGMEPSPSAAPNRYRFAGMERDGTSGLDHTPYRQYAAAMGRWMTPDPYDGSYDLANPQSFNRYLYVNGNPLSSTDPSGLWITPIIPCGDEFCMTVYVDCPMCAVVAGIIGGVAELLNVLGVFHGAQFSGTTLPRPPVPSTPSTPSASGTSSVVKAASCASKFADKYSIAGGLHALNIGTNGAGEFITNALGGNTFSGITNLGLSFSSGSAGGHSVFTIWAKQRWPGRRKALAP